MAEQTSNWYAIRTVPGAQLPQREFGTEITRSQKGYRIVSVVNPGKSAIERALEDAGIEHWMPSEKRLQRDRRKTHVWRVRRFALMVGYVFVRNPSWSRLRDMPLVHGIVGVNGTPLPIDIMDILMVRRMEAKAEIAFDKAAREARQIVRKAAKHDPALRKLVDSFDITGNITVPLDQIAA
ncbi:transcription termination/antitermination protein NusG [Phyllobacterium sp. 22229]|uniref:transcription termination/antitermination protein NusG n=1 Tax=Phyllobacterium sp. 22229 TaxID=3453895 RepID=UPI003F849033